MMAIREAAISSCSLLSCTVLSHRSPPLLVNGMHGWVRSEWMKLEVPLPAPASLCPPEHTQAPWGFHA